MVDGPIVLVRKNEIIYRASAVGGCIRSLWAARSGFDPKGIPEQFQAIFARGHELEEITKSILQSIGYIIINNQYELHVDLGPMVELKPVWVLGHIDCDTKLLPEQQYILTEIKGFGKALADKFIKTDITGFPTYKYQISSYLHARQQTRWRFVIYQKTLPGVDEDSPTRLIIRDYEKPPIPLDELRLRVEHVEYMVSTNTDPSKVLCTSNYPCPYFYLHDTTEALPLTKQQVASIRVIKSIDEKMAALQEVKDNLRKQLTNQLASEMKYRDGKWTVYFSENPDRIDTDKVKEIMKVAEVPYDDYMVRGKGKRLNIREKKPTKGD